MKNILNSIWNDHKMLFSADGRAAILKNNQHKHFLWSGLICLFALPVFVYFNQFMVTGNDQTMNFLFGVFVSGAIAWICNATREEYYDRKYKKATKSLIGIFDWRDVRFGWYGGVYIGIVVMAVLQYHF